jgi:uncharacterized repeat protein (TIGR04076 family)
LSNHRVELDLDEHVGDEARDEVRRIRWADVREDLRVRTHGALPVGARSEQEPGAEDVGGPSTERLGGCESLADRKERLPVRVAGQQGSVRVHRRGAADGDVRTDSNRARIGGDPLEPAAIAVSLAPSGHGRSVYARSMTEMQLYDVRVTVERIEGRSVCGLTVGDWFEVTESSRVRIPEGKHFCLFAIQAVLPLLPAKMRRLPTEDWLERDNLVCCPDPEEGLVMRIERLGERTLRTEDLT